ncbi:MAG: hypothetical protein L0Z70_05135 [Chloroflexi bacterium]|nr:hypothetical protein [Chloroflexota bacterium]
MNIVPVDLANTRQVKQFLQLPFDLYAGIPQWTPPLAADARRQLDRQRNPYYQFGDALFLLALNDLGKAVGRLAVLDNRKFNQFNQESTAFFYLFECEEDAQTAAALFKSGFAWARRRGLTRILGPKGFTVFDGLGMLVRGFEHRPAFGLPYNPSYYPSLVESAGFTVEGELLSGYLDRQVEFPDKMLGIAERLQERRGLHIARCETRSELRRLVSQFKDLFNQTLTGTSGNAPISDQEVQALSDQMLWFADPRLIKIVMKGDQPVGFLLAYPDVSAAVQRARGRLFPFGWLNLLLELRRTRWININGVGMIDGYRGLGGTAILFSEMFKSVRDSHYRYADLVQIGVNNDKMLRELRDLGIDFYKTHRVYQRML